jgi:hypothetical protein
MTGQGAFMDSRCFEGAAKLLLIDRRAKFRLALAV